MSGLSVVVFLHHVIEGLVGQSEQEVGEIHAGKKPAAVLRVVLESAVVVGAVEAQRSDRFQCPDVGAELEFVMSFGPA